MIKIYKVEGDRLRQLETLAELARAEVGWIDLLNPTAEEDAAVESFLHISVPTLEDQKQLEPSERLYDEDGATYRTMSAVSMFNPEHPVRAPLSFILHDRTLVTVRYEEFVSISDYLQEARKRGGVPVSSAQGLMFDLIRAFINRIADTLEQLGGDIDHVSREIFGAKKQRIDRKTVELQVAIRRIGRKGDMVSMLRESLASIARLLLHHKIELGDDTDEATARRLATVQGDVSSLSDHAGFLSTKIAFLLEATLGMINLEQNQIIKIFSIAAVVFLPPTLVASIYGMNFEHMPELDSPYGYWIVLLIMAASAAAPLIYFKKKGWL